MASGDKSKLKSINNPLVASYAGAGTYCWCVTKGGRLVRYTLSGGAVQATAFIRGPISCIYTDNTTIYIGMKDGRLLSYTVADKSNSKLAKFESAITGMSVTGGLIIISLSNGRLYSYEI